MEPIKGIYHNPSDADVSFEIGQRPWDPPVKYACKGGGFMDGPVAYASAFQRLAGLVLVAEAEAASIRAAQAEKAAKVKAEASKAEPDAAKKPAKGG